MPRKHQGKVTTASGDDLGKVQFEGTDGRSDNILAASIEATAAANASSGIVPGALSIKTANSSGTLTEAIGINSSQAVAFAGAVSLSGGVSGAVAFTGGEITLAGNALAAPGVGISNGSGTVFQTSVYKIGGIITTRILIDLTGLNGGDTGGDIIGVNGAGAAYLTQITAATNGTVFGGRVMCLETPTGGNVDVDLWAANEATGVEDSAISALTGEAQLINHGNWAAGQTDGLTAPPGVNQYLYLTNGAATDATYTAGQFMIELWGYDA